MTMMQSKITDVFFDLDHTLWDFDKNSALAFQRVFLKHNIDLDIAAFILAYEPINLIYWKKYREDLIGKEQMRKGRLLETFQKLKVSIAHHEIDELAHSYIQELPLDNYLLEGTQKMLDYLKSKYRLHIITNGFQEVQVLKLKRSKIDTYFQTVTASDEVGKKKPHPSIFDFALRRAGVEARNSIMIGDSFEADILGAQSAGMNTLFFNCREEKVISPYVDIKTLSEIVKHL